MSCVSASRPVDAVSAGGRSRVNSGIHHRQARQQVRAAQAGFDAMLGRSQHGVAGDFGTRAGGGGDGDERRRWLLQRLAAPHHFQVIERLAGVAEHRRHGFAGVDGAAAAHGHHHVAAFAARVDGAGRNCGDRRFSRNTKRRHCHSGRFQRQRKHRRPVGPFACHQQYAPAHRGRRRSHVAHGANAKHNSPRCRELEWHRPYQSRLYQSPSAGSIARYNWRVRGSANISAVLAAQAA